MSEVFSFLNNLACAYFGIAILYGASLSQRNDGPVFEKAVLWPVSAYQMVMK